MKHVFVVQSNFTYLAALGVIKAESLPIEHCVFVSEGYVKQSPVEVNVIPTFWGFKKGGYSWRQYFNPCKVINGHIDRLIGGEAFVAYVSVVTKLSRFIITDKRCSAYHFIEEGMSSYLTSYPLPMLTTYNASEPYTSNLWHRILSIKLALRGYSPRMSAIPIYYAAHIDSNRKYYGFTPHSHPYAPSRGRIVMDMRGVFDNFGLKAQYNLDNQIVWIGNCVDDAAPFEHYLNAIEELFVKSTLLGQGVKMIYVKFHYRDQPIHRSRAMELFKRYGIEVLVIDDSTIMEVELMAGCSISLYGTNSTLLFYGGLLGHSSYSVERMYNSGTIEQLIPVFWKYVNRI